MRTTCATAPPKSARRRAALLRKQSIVLPSDVLNCVKRIKNRCASSRQHTLLTSGS
nr:hypothetical protein [Methylomarinum sp. Ch1-1]MDP4521181.1 hypothetical protein [Methylomarinum sp. Ch1-1]